MSSIDKIEPDKQQVIVQQVEKKTPRALSQTKVEHLLPSQVDLPIQDVAQEQITCFKNDQERILILYSNKDLPFAASQDWEHGSLLTNEAFYLKWIKANAEMMNQIIATERSEKKKRQYWAALKDSFFQELKKIQKH